MDASELMVEYDDLGIPVRVRMDLFRLSQFVNEQALGEAANEITPVELFWESWRPRAIQLDGTNSMSGYNEDPPPLPPEKENAFLEELARLERECRIPYSPDVDLSATLSQFNAASQYVHVGGASALRHLKRDGFSDDVRKTLIEVNRVLRVLEIDNRLIVNADATGHYISLFGVMSLVLNALSRINYLDGEYEEAFKSAVVAMGSFASVSDAVEVDVEFLLDFFGEDGAKVEGQIRSVIRSKLRTKDMEPQKLVDAFEGLRMQNKSQSWSMVARDCRFLSLPADDNLMWETVTGADGREEPWFTYWHRAEGWATAQLSSNEYRELRRQDEEEASLKRLARYFFGETWGNIPEKAREHLINVDVLWFTEARWAATDAVLNDLQVAAETMCHAFIWEPLQKSKGDRELLRFVERDNELNKNYRFPTLSDYTWVCRQGFFKTFVQSLELDEKEQVFLTTDLENDLDFLRRGRDIAQHDSNSRLRRDDVERLVMLFLGIGQPGVLRRLAEIGPKLTGK